VVGPNRLFEKPKEEEPSRAGVTPVESERVLIEVVIQVLVADASLVRSQEPALHEGGDAVTPGISTCAGYGEADW